MHLCRGFHLSDHADQNSQVSINIVTPYILNEYSIEIGLKQHWLGR